MQFMGIIIVIAGESIKLHLAERLDIDKVVAGVDFLKKKLGAWDEALTEECKFHQKQECLVYCYISST